MTGYISKKAAALDEEGMYLVHHTKRKDEDDDIQVYKRPWVDLTDDEKTTAIWTNGSFGAGALWAEAKLKEKNT